MINLSYADYSKTTFKRAEDRNVKEKYKKIKKKEKYKTEREYKREDIEQKDTNDNIYFRGTVTIVDKWYEYTEIYIENKDGEEIRARISKKSLWKVDDIVIARCKNYVSGFYRDCRIRRTY